MLSITFLEKPAKTGNGVICEMQRHVKSNHSVRIVIADQGSGAACGQPSFHAKGEICNSERPVPPWYA